MQYPIVKQKKKIELKFLLRSNHQSLTMMHCAVLGSLVANNHQSTPKMDAAVRENKAMEQKTIFSPQKGKGTSVPRATNLKYIIALHCIACIQLNLNKVHK
jgi:hypothetical protein